MDTITIGIIASAITGCSLLGILLQRIFTTLDGLKLTKADLDDMDRGLSELERRVELLENEDSENRALVTQLRLDIVRLKGRLRQ